MLKSNMVMKIYILKISEKNENLDLLSALKIHVKRLTICFSY